MRHDLFKKPADDWQLMFVYGTMLRGMRNNARLKGGHYLCDAVTVNKYRMTVGFWRQTNLPVPYVDPRRRTHHIKGELWLVDRELLSHVDKKEGHPTFYHRNKAAIRTENGKEVRAWVYFMTRAEGRWVARGGDFANFINRHFEAA
jgi:gamma-glutamylcyclotransferase (GGCT)/AIG2-like uncharacterized protein YtfP